MRTNLRLKGKGKILKWYLHTTYSRRQPPWRQPDSDGQHHVAAWLYSLQAGIYRRVFWSIVFNLKFARTPRIYNIWTTTYFISENSWDLVEHFQAHTIHYDLIIVYFGSQLDFYTVVYWLPNLVQSCAWTQIHLTVTSRHVCIRISDRLFTVDSGSKLKDLKNYGDMIESSNLTHPDEK